MPTVADIMTKDVLTLDPEMSLRDAVQILGDGEVTGAPVLRGGRLVGVVSATDLLAFQEANPAPTAPDEEGPPSLREELEAQDFEPGDDPHADVDDYFAGLWEGTGADVYQRLAGTDSPEWDLLARHTVGEVMTRKTFTLSAGSELREAARLMTEQSIHRILVTDGDELAGIVSTMDLVRAIADGVFDRRPD